jgi:hypothetical protein
LRKGGRGRSLIDDGANLLGIPAGGYEVTDDCVAGFACAEFLFDERGDRLGDIGWAV